MEPRAASTVMYILQISALFISITSSISQRFDALGRPKCCSNSLSPDFRRHQTWVDTLREATYHSIIRHLDFTGTLDGRLERDHALWKHLQEAKYIVSEYSPLGEDIKEGFLIDTTLDSHRINFEFHETDKPLFQCSPGQCHIKNNSLLATWRIRRSELPYGLRIQVNLPNIKDVPLEDIYEYSEKNGLKKLNPDPIQYHSLDTQKGHRFSLPLKSKKSDSEERMDRFLGIGQLFGIGKIIPTSFKYDPPIVSGKTEDGWIISSPRKPNPGDTVETSIKTPIKGPSYKTVLRPFVPSGLHDFHHITQSLPSISPPQDLDYPPQEIRGFLPSVGPLNAPPPYKTEYDYNPKFVLFYNSQPNLPTRHPTQISNFFKPSTEYVRYSEIDPFYHPNGKTDILSTTPIPYHSFHKTIKNFPKSINDQLPANLPTVTTNPPFKIIVENIKPIQKTTITPINKPVSTTEVSKHTTFKPRLRNQEKSKVIENEKYTTKAFGEKIKPKIPTTQMPEITTTKTRSSTKAVNSDYRGPNSKKEQNKTYNLDFENYTTIPDNYTATVFQDGQKVNAHSMYITETEITEIITESTTEDSAKKTTYVQLETTNGENEEEEPVTIANIEKINENTTKTLKTTLKTTQIIVSGPTERIQISNETKKNTKDQNDSEMKTDDYYIDDLTETGTESSTTSDQTNFEESDLTSALTDSLFPKNTVTQNNEDLTTVTMENTNIKESEPEMQESKHQKYRVLTFPGDPVSIIANRISKSISYKTATGKERQLQTKEAIPKKNRLSDMYKDYSTIL